MIDNIKKVVGATLIILSVALVPFLLGWLINTGVVNLIQHLVNILFQTNYNYNVWVIGLVWQLLNVFIFRNT